MKITLKDGSVKEYAQAMAIIDIAKDISEGLARVACVAEVNGEVVDLRTVVDADCELNILTAKDPAGLSALRLLGGPGTPRTGHSLDWRPSSSTGTTPLPQNARSRLLTGLNSPSWLYLQDHKPDLE